MPVIPVVMYISWSFLIIPIVFLTLAPTLRIFGEEYSCENTICNPRAGDLLIGRESSLIASSTCGLDGLEAYCVVTTSGKSFCKECISSQPYNSLTNPESHRIENVVSRVPSDSNRWWQSENAVHNVTIRLDLDTQFQFISTILRFKTYRPAAMYLERSYDFGRNWKSYAYFSNNCQRDFPTVPETARRSLTDVTCTSIYSQLTPSEGGVVAYMAAPSEMHEAWPQYSKERMNLTAITNLRAVFTRLNTLVDMRVDDSSLNRRKYYYALFEWNVWGRCTCFGHAKRCKPKSSAEVVKLEKVYGVCECTHNTAGENCETCAEFYANKPWRPADKDSPNACERCDCNEHADTCFFNPLLYEQSGNVSGGNCYDCIHNTEGAKCEFCKQNFYRHPSYSDQHPMTCQPCNCHLDGSLYDGFCQQYTVKALDTVAGRCLCKQNVGGEKCDRCKVGFWNFQANDPDGCQACSCNMMGTLDNGGCDPFTGLCTCKRFVGGPNCDECLDGYFNLTLAPLGCQMCGCSQLGARSPNCSRINGKCECKAGFTGRDCSQVEDGYFVSPPSEIIDGGGQKEITLDGPTGKGQFVIVLDVDPKQFGQADRWTIIVKPYQYGATRCQNPPQTVNVFQDTTKIIITDVCLEAGLPIVLRIMPEAKPAGPYTEILISDIILVPLDDSNVARRCEIYREVAIDILSGRDDDIFKLPPECEVYFRLPRVSWRETGSIAKPCHCDTTGSKTDVCDKVSGQCPCKPGVTGRSCDKCQPYHYDFSASGCTDCACSPQGSVSLQCDTDTSQCECKPGIHGKHCDMCKPGQWNFPDCKPCYCNGLSDLCDQKTGYCTHCRDNTGGNYCGACAEGYYGGPLDGTKCKACACPGGGINHASECSMGPLREQICKCKIGYTGTLCSECAMNYFGNPTEVNGVCQPCQCSGNIAPNEPGGCDPETGRCLKCLYNTEGFSCNICEHGYWGDATRQMCQACNCRKEGTVGEGKLGCDKTRGQCDCLPNVIGARCHQCAEGFFNLTLGKGCEPCDCDASGSESFKCNPDNGECKCKSDRSGRKCDQCRSGTYGDPTEIDGCKPCNCSISGSTSFACDPVTGQCPCRTGIAGQLCDRCDRGTKGKLPNCEPCGECWTNWDKAIDKVDADLNRLQNQTGRQLPDDLKILFNMLVDLLKQVESSPWMKLTEEKNGELETILTKTEDLMRKLNTPDTGLYDELKANLTTESHNNEDHEIKLKDLHDSFADIKQQFDQLTDNIGQVQRYNPEGANQAVMEAQKIKKRAIDEQGKINSMRIPLQNMITDVKASLERSKTSGFTVIAEWSQLDRIINGYSEKLKQINRLLCGDNNDPPSTDVDPNICPSSCGGAACDPVSSQIGPKKSALVRVLRSTDIKFPIDFVKQVVGIDYNTGLIGGCGVNLGCNASIGGRINQLMLDNLIFQQTLARVVNGVYDAKKVINTVHSDRIDAESAVVNASNGVAEMENQLESMLNKTEALINEATEYLTKYSNFSKEQIDQAIQEIQAANLNVSLTDARTLVTEMRKYSKGIEKQVQTILTETEADRKKSTDLRERAEETRSRAQNFAEQVNQLKEADRIYKDLQVHPALNPDDDTKDKVDQLRNQVEGLEAQMKVFANQPSEQADAAKEASKKVQAMLLEANTFTADNSRILTDLQNIGTSYKQLSEKMTKIEEQMKKLQSNNATDEQDKEEESGVVDPTKLKKKVDEYTQKMEKNIEEIREINENINQLDGQSEALASDFKINVSKMRELEKHLSLKAKFHSNCK